MKAVINISLFTKPQKIFIFDDNDLVTEISTTLKNFQEDIKQIVNDYNIKEIIITNCKLLQRVIRAIQKNYENTPIKITLI